jgi:hypothetical protein
VQRQKDEKKELTLQAKKEEDLLWREKLQMIEKKFEITSHNLELKKVRLSKSPLTPQQEQQTHENELKKELRRLREEEIRRLRERKQALDQSRKLEIIQKEALAKDQLAAMRST